MMTNDRHERAIGEWWLDEGAQALCIDVVKGYEYWIDFGLLKEKDWSGHLSMKNWMTPGLMADFERLRSEVLAR